MESSSDKQKFSQIVVVPQTKIAMIGYLLLIVAFVLAYAKNPTPMGLVVMSVYVLLAALALYVINCTVLGKCNLYAWIVGYATAVIGALAILSAIMKLIKV